MIKKIRLLGMELDNFSLREEILLGESFYDKNELSVVRTVSINTLSLAVKDDRVRRGIAEADLLIVEDKEILLEAGIRSAQRLRDAGEHGFMQEYLRRMDNTGRRVFLTAADGVHLDELRDFLNRAYERLQIVGSYVLEDCNGEYDVMVNEINASAPDVVLSAIESPDEEAFLLQARPKISAKVWFSLGGYYHEPSSSFLLKFRQMIHKGRFRNVVHHYEDDDE